MSDELKIMVNPNTNRVIGWSINPMDEGIHVREKPPENYYDYLWLDGQYVYSPAPAEEEPVNPIDERIRQLEEQNEALMECLLEMSEIVYA